ncbi:ATP-binding protein [Thioflexithrix psekupsensis]|uniref:ATP-binding protein n=1 Tax=Thioflexithrix psekupsensis TaxID=1570016 RepID=A0A251X311_9GAMM|nr:ATP-binding protein [Thioflexithrix psekupsensis]OUD11665.1 hypothetical protein TPSD3_16555 [Thioflexithrix psekupsensis]
MENKPNISLINPFQPFAPLQPEMDQAIFRGRADLANRLILLPLFPEHKTTLVLSGPMRSGKTSFLNMLPSLLTENCLFIQLTPNTPYIIPDIYFQTIVEQAREQIKARYHLILPSLPSDHNPYQAGLRWLDGLNHRGNELQIVLLLDDFEKLPDLFVGGRFAFLDFLALLQKVVTQFENIHLLLSSEYTLEEMIETELAWLEYLPKFRQLYLELLSPVTAKNLLQQPVITFPEQLIDASFAESIAVKTGGHPYLLQLFGYVIVEFLNEQQQNYISPKDKIIMTERVLEMATPFFQQIMQKYTAFHTPLMQMAKNEIITTEFTAMQQRYLKRHWLLNEKNKLAIPLLQQWLIKNQSTNELTRLPTV